jgi:hypothetical protein
MIRAPLSSFVLLITSCVAGPPPSWSRGARWTLPILDPFDGGVLATLGSVNGNGPWVFFLDTGSAQSTLTTALVEAIGGQPISPSFFFDGTDRSAYVARVGVERLRDWQIGDLTIRNPSFLVTHALVDSYRGLPVGGTIGLDVLRPYLVLEVDRDAGVIHIALPRSVTVPPQPQPGHLLMTEERLRVTTTIDGRDTVMVLDTGNSISTIYPSVARQLALPPDPEARTRVRAFSGDFEARGAYQVRSLRIGGMEADGLRLWSQPDSHQYGSVSLDGGFLGQDVLSRYHVFADLEERRLVLAPRARVTSGSSMLRFGELVQGTGQLPSCGAEGCVEGIHMALAQPGSVLVSVNAARPRPIELELELVDGRGEALAAPFRFGVRVPAGAAPVAIRLPLDPGAAWVARAHDVRVRDLRPTGPLTEPTPWWEPQEPTRLMMVGLR